jgi:glucokinase
MITAGVDIGGTKTLAATVDGTGRIMHRTTTPTDPKAGTSSILAALTGLISAGKATPELPSAIGVGVAAWVTYPEGVVAFAPNLDYEDENVRDAVKRRFGLPVVVENDATAAAWGEKLYGAAKDSDDFLMITIGTGIGGGAVLGGKLYRGHQGFASEFGHMTIDSNGPACACGQRGCLEALASGSAVGRMAREALEPSSSSLLKDLASGDLHSIDGAMVTRAAASGDGLAREILEEAGRFLGIGLFSLTQAFDPELIVVGGGGGDRFLVDAAEKAMTYKLGQKRRAPRVELAKLGNDAGVIGCAALARESL